MFLLNNRNPDLKPILGKLIKSLRLKHNISQEDLAGLCDVDRSYISLVERGQNEPSVSKIFEICNGLKIKPSDFFRLVEIECGKLKDK
ncbi:helix-turn-helix domain-containing protein [Paenibacillus dokdonensis]|uniref:helix-turn-helix domain-containing protein n=1 Tax=Paenibacillus dokdonensis TaxID=2567944 RepID=UPI001FECA0B9|nr:helix-turn-helix transcriptional regulator [Paenibacillus dokdonensis]